ncbi:MAG: GNAT family N-acetyltransferase [Bradymonadaceae bacterium]
MADADELIYRRAELDEVLPLRTRVFRPLLAGLEPFRIEADVRTETTRHYAAEDSQGDVVAVTTVFEDECPEFPGESARRIFGFAVVEQWRGRGIGGRLFEYLRRDTAQAFPETEILWGNARVGSTGFWELLGFELWGEPFEIEGRGEHRIAAQRVDVLAEGAEERDSQV